MPERLFQIFLRQGIAKVYHTRDQPTPTGASIQSQRFIYLSLATLASELRDIAMQFSQQFRPNPGTQMEVIHILRDEEFQFTQILQLYDRSMTRIWLDRSEGSGFWWKSFFLSRPDAIRSSKIRQS
jgi:hypothetical protein